MPFANKPKKLGKKRTLTLEDHRAQLYEKEESQANRLMGHVRQLQSEQRKIGKIAADHNKVQRAKKVAERRERTVNSERNKELKVIKNRMAQQGKKFVEKRYAAGKR